MTDAASSSPVRPLAPTRGAYTEAVAELHLLSLRRQFDAIHMLFGPHPPHRAREALWVGLEVVLAHLRGQPIALRDLVNSIGGLLSAPTLSRVIGDLERSGLLVSEPAPDNASVRQLRPTARALDFLAARSDAAFAEFALLVHKAERNATR